MTDSVENNVEERIEKDFFRRDQEDQQAFLQYTWCQKCMEVDLGMVEPCEYELGETTFIEGKCKKCGETVVTELQDEDDEE
jgi:hypothetical protein